MHFFNLTQETKQRFHLVHCSILGDICHLNNSCTGSLCSCSHVNWPVSVILKVVKSTILEFNKLNTREKQRAFLCSKAWLHSRCHCRAHSLQQATADYVARARASVQPYQMLHKGSLDKLINQHIQFLSQRCQHKQPFCHYDVDTEKYTDFETRYRCCSDDDFIVTERCKEKS